MNIVFLHGFLGASEDWDEVIHHLGGSFDCYPIQLPENLEAFPDIPPCILVGYSMGGRVALQLQKKFPERIKGLALLSAHFGLEKEEEREKRWKEDCLLAEKLENMPIHEFLQFWYAQPLFTGLQVPERRLQIDIDYNCSLLKTYSLGKQPFLAPPQNTLLLYGEHDTKYKTLYQAYPQAIMIENASHAIHLQNPKAVADALRKNL